MRGAVVSEDNVIPLGNITTLDLDPHQMLKNAMPEIDGGVVLIGRDSDGDLFFASSIADGGDVLWLLEMAKKELLEISAD